MDRSHTENTFSACFLKISDLNDNRQNLHEINQSNDQYKKRHLHHICTGSHKAAKGKGFASGETVTLYYDPEDPEKMYVEGDRSVLGAEILYFCLAVVLLALMVSFIR